MHIGLQDVIIDNIYFCGIVLFLFALKVPRGEASCWLVELYVRTYFLRQTASCFSLAFKKILLYKFIRSVHMWEVFRLHCTAFVCSLQHVDFWLFVIWRSIERGWCQKRNALWGPNLGLQSAKNTRSATKRKNNFNVFDVLITPPSGIYYS